MRPRNSPLRVAQIEEETGLPGPIRIHRPPPPGPSETMPGSRSLWSIRGSPILMLTWSAEEFSRLTELDRRVIRNAMAREMPDGSWHLLLLAVA